MYSTAPADWAITIRVIISKTVTLEYWRRDWNSQLRRNENFCFWKMGELLGVTKALVESQKTQLQNQKQQFRKDSSRLLKAETQKKSSEEDLSFFTAKSIPNSITESKYYPEERITLSSYSRRYTDLYKKECENWTDGKSIYFYRRK